MVRRVDREHAEQEEFKVSNWKLANAFSEHLDALLDDYHEIAEFLKLDDERALRLGEWSRIKFLSRSEIGDDFLSEEDCKLLDEEWQFFAKHKDFVFTDRNDSSLDNARIDQFEEWHNSSLKERWAAFIFYFYLRCISGQGNENEMVYLFGQSHQFLSYINADDEESIRRRIAEEEKQRMSLKGKNLNVERHKKTHAARNMTTSEWEKNTTKFPSAEKAGLYFSDWLETQGYKYEPRTVTSWIRSHAKNIGVKFR